MAVKIVTDSTSDLPADLAEDLGITIVPANVYFGANEYKDGVDMTGDEFFDRLINGPDFPRLRSRPWESSQTHTLRLAKARMQSSLCMCLAKSAERSTPPSRAPNTPTSDARSRSWTRCKRPWGSG